MSDNYAPRSELRQSNVPKNPDQTSTYQQNITSSVGHGTEALTGSATCSSGSLIFDSAPLEPITRQICSEIIKPLARAINATLMLSDSEDDDMDPYQAFHDAASTPPRANDAIFKPPVTPTVVTVVSERDHVPVRGKKCSSPANKVSVSHYVFFYPSAA